MKKAKEKMDQQEYNLYISLIDCEKLIIEGALKYDDLDAYKRHVLEERLQNVTKKLKKEIEAYNKIFNIPEGGKKWIQESF